MSDTIPYASLRDRALRFMMRWALEAAAGPGGMPGQHHFYITFRTHAPGVVIPEAQRTRYPDEMVIVLKSRFRDLRVDDDGFAAVLWFDDEPAEIRVPFEAVRQFVDPSASIVLRFEADTPGHLRLEPPPPKETLDDSSAEVVSLDAFRRRQDDDD